ncbi:MAG: hypothetical protein LCI00_30585 [Chloroflexi bacterium]|nr:hypothetical protein [Chloroflexota bacterium]MCC6894741.1 hypothetical protein [Anaerolineae bacterium]
MSRYDNSGNYAPDSKSKYRRPRYPFSPRAVILGLIIGIAGGLYYAWNVDQRVEFDTEPWQLNEADRSSYIAGITLQYTYDSDLTRAVNRLLVLKLPGDPIQAVADTACKLASSSYIDNSSGQRAVRSMMTFYQLQGRTGCADTLLASSEIATPGLVIEASTPTLRPPATKTPTPEPILQATPTIVQAIVIPTIQPQADFVLADVRTFCSAELSGIIEIRVQDFNGEGIPGTSVTVNWDSGSSTFVTGLKPERGADYADFQMDAGKSYTVQVTGRSDPSQALVAGPCNDANSGQPALISYRATFRPQ